MTGQPLDHAAIMDPQDVRDAHRAQPDGRCRECSEPVPCTAVQMADQATELADAWALCREERDNEGRRYVAMRADRDRLAAALAAAQEREQEVRELHQPVYERRKRYNYCTDCSRLHPCPTIRALDAGAALAGERPVDQPESRHDRWRLVDDQPMCECGKPWPHGEGAADQPQAEDKGWQDIAHGMKQPCRCDGCRR